MRIKDRLILGAVTGLLGNIPKLALIAIAKRFNWAIMDGPGKAAGMLVPAHRIATPQGRLVGYLADATIAALLGVTTVYVLSATGKDRAVLKGALGGQAGWTGLYGVLTTMGATKVQAIGPRTVLAEFVAHTVFGAVAGWAAVKLGDEGLFTGRVPLSAAPYRVQEQSGGRRLLLKKRPAGLAHRRSRQQSAS
ncbi:MAG: hypothetical protein AB1500_05270 [Bacillota bacterium]